MSTTTVTFTPGFGWLLEQPAGPLGSIPMMLVVGTGLRAQTTVIHVDVELPERIVQLTIPLTDRDAADPAVVDLAVRLLGQDVSGAVRAAATRGTTLLQVPDVPSDALLELAELTRVETLTRHRSPLSRIGCLDLVAEGGGSLPEADELRTRHTLTAVRCATALGRASRRSPAVVDDLPAADRAVLLDRVRQLRAVLVQLRWGQAGQHDLEALEDLLGEVPDFVPAMEGLSLAGAFRGPDAAPRVEIVTWSCTKEELRLGLGALADRAYAGVTASGRAPGAIDVVMPLALPPGQTVAEQLVARIVRWDGEVLAEQAMRIQVVGSGLVRAVCRLRLERSARPDQAVLLVDRADRPLPSPGQLRQLARVVAARLGLQALLAARAGEHDIETERWRDCAAVLAAVGEEAAAEQARVRAAATDAGGSADWMLRLHDSWLRQARRQLEQANGDLELLLRLKQELLDGFDPVEECVAVCRAIAQQLLSSDDPEETADGLDQLWAALSLSLRLGDSVAADAVARQLEREQAAVKAP